MLTKKLPVTLALGLALVTLEAGAAGAPKSVMDYYQEVPKSLFPNETKYELKKAKSGWITHSMDTEEEISATVDTKNGFIQFIDQGTGGGDAKTQVALFLKEDKSPLIAISTSMFDGMASNGHIALVTPEGGQWKAVTSTVLPALRPTDFLDAKCLAALKGGCPRNARARGRHLHTAAPGHHGARLGHAHPPDARGSGCGCTPQGELPLPHR